MFGAKRTSSYDEALLNSANALGFRQKINALTEKTATRLAELQNELSAAQHVSSVESVDLALSDGATLAVASKEVIKLQDEFASLTSLQLGLQTKMRLSEIDLLNAEQALLTASNAEVERIKGEQAKAYHVELDRFLRFLRDSKLLSDALGVRFAFLENTRLAAFNGDSVTLGTLVKIPGSMGWHETFEPSSKYSAIASQSRTLRAVQKEASLIRSAQHARKQNELTAANLTRPQSSPALPINPSPDAELERAKAQFGSIEFASGNMYPADVPLQTKSIPTAFLPADLPA